MKNIFFTGDIHGEFRHLNPFINKKRPKHIICAGDFGFWPGEEELETRYLGSRIKKKKHKLWSKDYRKGPPELKNPNTKIVFCDGNHENHKILQALAKKNNFEPFEISKNIIYVPRGSILEIDNFKILFIGGARSTDTEERKEGKDYFIEEDIKEEDIDRALKNAKNLKIDCVISHAAPKSFKFKTEEARLDDINRRLLDTLLKEIRPSFWLFGHYHMSRFGKYRNTYWTALNQILKPGWFISLNKVLKQKKQKREIRSKF